MGFSGGGANITKSHTHSSSIVQDGGALNFDNVTQAGLAAGDITYSNGTALQVLNLGNATETLTVNAGATAPEWGSGGGGGYTFIEQFTAAASSTFTCTLASALNVSDFVEIVAIWRGRWDEEAASSSALELQIGTDNSSPITTSSYSWSANVLKTSSVYASGVDVDNFTVGPSITSQNSIGNIVINLTIGQDDGGNTDKDVFLRWWQTGNDKVQNLGSGFVYDSSTIGSITSLNFTNSAGNNISTSTVLDLYKITSS